MIGEGHARPATVRVMHVRRLLLLAVSTLLAVVAVTALLSPVPPAGEGTEETASSPAGSTASREGAARDGSTEPATEGASDLEVLSAAATDQRVRVPVGRALRVRVESDEPVGVQLGADGPVEYADEGAPAEFAVFGEAGYDEPVRLLESERVIGRITAVAAR